LGSDKVCPSLRRDTFADKAFRFVIGALLGITAAWYFLCRGTPLDDRQSINTLIIGGALVGGLAVLGGNRFVERFIRGRYWE